MQNTKLVMYIGKDPRRLERLAKSLGVHISTLYRWQKGTKPPVRMRAEVAKKTKGAVPEWSW